MEKTTHYGGIVIVTHRDQLASCAQNVDRLPGVEVHFRYPARGRLIAVQEGASAGELEHGLRRIQALPDVVAAALVEHRIESDDRLEERA